MFIFQFYRYIFHNVISIVDKGENYSQVLEMLSDVHNIVILANFTKEICPLTKITPG